MNNVLWVREYAIINVDIFDEGLNVVKVFFMHDGEVKLVEVSVETVERLRKFAWGNGLSVPEAVNDVYNAHNEVSERLIIEYLNISEASKS